MTGPLDLAASMTSLAASVSKSVAMIYVADVTRSLEWYTAMGFTELTRFEEDGDVNFGMVSMGKAEVMFNPHGERGPNGVSLWFYTDQVDAIYQLLHSRGVEFGQHIEDMFYGARQFSIYDPDGYELYFIQSLTVEAD